MSLVALLTACAILGADPAATTSGEGWTAHDCEAQGEALVAIVPADGPVIVLLDNGTSSSPSTNWVRNGTTLSVYDADSRDSCIVWAWE